MLISEKRIRYIIRKQLMSEVVQWGGRSIPGLDFKCEFAEKLPENVKRFIQLASVNFSDAFRNIAPGDGLEKALADEKSFASKLGKDTGLVTGLVSEIAAMSVSYTAAIGAPCVLFYWGNLILEKLTQLLTALGLFKESKYLTGIRSDIESANIVQDVDFKEPILQRAKSIAPRDLGTLKSFYPFYVFPRLSGRSDYEQGQRTEDLERDIIDYHEKIKAVRSIRDQNVKTVIRKISKIIDAPVSVQDSNNIDAIDIEKLKQTCLIALAEAYTEASKSFDHIPTYNTILTQSANAIF